MSPETLQIAVLIATGAVAVLVPMMIFLLASRIRNAAHESTQAALAQASQQHRAEQVEFTHQYDQSLAQFAQHYDRSLGDFARVHDRRLTEYARQHERALAELAAEHKRIAGEFGMFSRKRHEVYARLYSRYRRATHDFTTALTGHEPEFQKFSRDDLLRYLKGRDIRERDAADAIAAMDRGDLFAMSRLMAKLHWRATLRDANAAFERAHQFESLNELYLSDAVREAVGNVRRRVEALSYSLSRETERADQAKRLARQDELHSSVTSLLHAMRNDLSAGTDVRPRPGLERTPPRGALAAPGAEGLADKAAPAKPRETLPLKAEAIGRVLPVK